MKSFFTYFILLLTISLSAQNQNPFTAVAEQAIQLDEEYEVSLSLENYITFELQREVLQAQLAHVPLERMQNLKTANHQISLPLPDGSIRRYKVVESPVMESELQARWPQLRTYRLLDANNASFSGRISVTPQGVHAVFQSPKGEVFLEPYAYGQDRYHVVYYQKDVVLNDENIQQLSCGYSLNEHDEDDHFDGHHTDLEEASFRSTTGGAPAVIREYQLALTCTGEYAQIKGGTVESVLSSFVSAVNIVNTTFEREVGIRVVLINRVEDLIFLYPSSDPFIDADVGDELLGQVRDAIVLTAGIFPGAYDMGHIFTAACTDVGGVVGGGSRVCGGNKEEAVTCHYSNNLTTVVRRVMTHEIAHHFNVGHTFSYCPGNQENVEGATAFEPGSGSTIMSYAGACGDNQNIQNNSDDYYHSASLEEFIYFTRQGNGNTCPTLVQTTSSQPEITLPYTDGFYIPISTPFELNGEATDMDDDPLTYCWEQMDLDFIEAPLEAPVGNAPLFRSFPPNGATNRYFPRIQDIINNQNDNREVLPTYSRDLTFRFSVRDNNQEIGSSVWEDIAFHSTSTAGPFRVLEPNVSTVEWRVGEYREIRWDVANTDNELVNCKRVNIRLSTDGGLTYPMTLLSETLNTGSAFITVPDAIGDNMRIRVEASNNVFFDISNANFEIKAANVATYTLGFAPALQQVCLPDLASVTFSTSSILGYDGLINLSVVSELPEGVEASFSAENIMPGEESQLNVNLLHLENFDDYLPITIAGVAPGQEIFYRTFVLDVVKNDFSELELLLPVDGQEEVSLITDFSWQEVNDAHSYDWQLSNDAGFNNIVASGSGLIVPEFTPNIQFDKNELYYWRVRGFNDCGPAEWRTPKVFHTTNIICSSYISLDTPVSIPGNGPLPTKISKIVVPSGGNISDLKVSYINVSYQPIQNFTISLISPSGTEVLLYDQTCFTTAFVNIGFDDEAPDGIICPPTGQLSFRPVEPLSTFIGEDSQGEWTLKVQVYETGFGAPGQIGEWALEFCADGNAVAPNLLTNETLFVPPLMSNPISNELLHVSDNEQGPNELMYSVVSVPRDGQLFLVDQELVPGSVFSQSSINALNLNYVNTNSDAIEDTFYFVVEDGTGGFLPVQRFNIVIDENAVVGTDEIVSFQNVRLFPNPAQDKITLQWDQATKDVLDVKILNVHGQVLYQNSLPKASYASTIDVNGWPAGVYFVQLGTKVLRMVKQ